MKVLLVNGSPHSEGCTYTALSEVAKTLGENGIETEIFQIGIQPVRGCYGCGKCAEALKCVFDDDLANALAEKINQADGVIVGSPVYYGAANGQLCALLDRVFFSASSQFRGKPAAAVVSCRRGGASAAFDRLNKYFTMSQMPLVTSQYWNSVHGQSPDEVRQDVEGLQIMRTLGRNMAYQLQAQKLAGAMPPPAEERLWTNFIH